MDCNRPSYRLYCKKKGACGRDYCVTVRDGKLCLALPNHCDPSQLWQKDDGEKCTFMLVHIATNKAVKYCNNGDQLYLVNKPHCPNKSVSWTQSGDLTCGYVFIRTTSNLNIVMDAWSGHVADGIKVISYPQKHSDYDNQLWKLVRFCTSLHLT